MNFDHGDYKFDAEFKAIENYAECIIESMCEDKDYDNLDVKDKNFIADKVNVEEVNHYITRAYDNTVVVHTSYYFSNTEMMLTIFCDRLYELVSSLRQLDELLTVKKNEYNAFKSRRVGFYIETDYSEKSEEEEFEIAAKASK